MIMILVYNCITSEHPKLLYTRKHRAQVKDHYYFIIMNMEVKHASLPSRVTFLADCFRICNFCFQPIHSTYHIVVSLSVDVSSKTSGRVRVAIEQVPSLRCLIFGGLVSGSCIVRLAHKSKSKPFRDSTGTGACRNRPTYPSSRPQNKNKVIRHPLVTRPRFSNKHQQV